MRKARSTSFNALAEGFLFLRQRPLWALSLGILTMALSALGSYFQYRLGVAMEDLPRNLLLASTAVLPMEIYFVPRFLTAVDAETRNTPENPAEQWKERFEGRWFRCFIAKLLLAAAFSLGFMLLVIPGLVILLVFGWAPYLVLLRGKSLTEAARTSAKWMAKFWPQALVIGLAIVLVYMGISLVIGFVHARFMPEPTPLARLTHPSAWIAEFLMGLLSLWFSAAFLALFQAIERATEADITS